MKLATAALHGRFTRLEPLDDGLREPLRAAIGGPDPVWDIMATSAQGDRFDAWWSTAQAETASRRRIAYAVRSLAEGKVVGTTSFLHIDPDAASLEIGSTFLNADARGGPANPDMKLAMLAHAFAAGAIRVEIRTDHRNLRSQAAIAKLGAVREGVLRKHKRLWNGERRDTVLFSILDDDWPVVRAGLTTRLSASEIV